MEYLGILVNSYEG